MGCYFRYCNAVTVQPCYFECSKHVFLTIPLKNQLCHTMLLQLLRQKHGIQLGPGDLVSKICVRLVSHSLRFLSHSVSFLTTINNKTEMVT